MSIDQKKIKSLVLDATPLITQSASSLQQHAEIFYTTPGVHNELKDEHSRQQLLLWAENLKIRHPKAEFIQKVSSFAKLTGDYQVLSANDIHIIALAYELEVEANGEDKLRKFPGDGKEKVKKVKESTVQVKEQEKTEEKVKEQVKEEEKVNEQVKEESTTKPEIEETVSEESKPQETEDDGWEVVPIKTPYKKIRRRGGKRQREKREAEDKLYMEGGVPTEKAEWKPIEEVLEQFEPLKVEETTEQEITPSQETNTEDITQESTTEADSPENTEESSTEILNEAYDENDDDGEWITPENLQEEILKDGNEQIKESNALGFKLIDVALSTGDFACQNVAMQIGLNLMNSMSGRQIKRVRNYMYRCHACFRLTPIPKDGTPKHFCPKCGGNTLLRCAVSIDTESGKVTPHLKSNFQWIKRGDKYSLASPLSKRLIKLLGNSGYQHNKENRHKTLQNPILLREDQKEYQRAVKDEDWQRKQNDKVLQEWVGGGSADNYMSPFTNSITRHSNVKIGKGRNSNATKSKGK